MKIHTWHRHGISALILVAFGFLAAGSLNTSGSSSSSSKGASATPDYTLTAVELWREYQANEVAADSKYKGKTLLVSGEVVGIDKDFLDNAVLSLRTRNEFMSVKATLDDSQKSGAASLSKGSMVSLLCKGNGAILGSPTLKDCYMKK